MKKLSLNIKDEYWYNDNGFIKKIRISEDPNHDNATIIVEIDPCNNTKTKIRRKKVSIQDLHIDKAIAVRHAMQSIYERQKETLRLISELKKFVKEHNVKDEDEDSLCIKND